MPGGPGNLSWQMPTRPDDLPRKQKDLQRSQREAAAGNILQGAQIGAGGITVTSGGAITFTGTGALNTTGALTTTGSFSAATSISAGTTLSCGGNLTVGGVINLSGGNLGMGGNSITGAANISASGTVSGGAFSGGSFSGSSLSCSGNIDSTSGRVYSSGAMQSPGSRATVVTVGYVNAYLDTNGVLGYQPSTRRRKKDLGSIPDSLLDATLRLPTYLGRYKTEESSAPRTPFLIAEDVKAAGYGPSVVPLDDDGEAAAINHQNLIPVLLELIKRQSARIDALEERLAGAGN